MLSKMDNVLYLSVRNRPDAEFKERAGFLIQLPELNICIVFLINRFVGILTGVGA